MGARGPSANSAQRNAPATLPTFVFPTLPRLCWMTLLTFHLSPFTFHHPHVLVGFAHRVLELFAVGPAGRDGFENLELHATEEAAFSAPPAPRRAAEQAAPQAFDVHRNHRHRASVKYLGNARTERLDVAIGAQSAFRENPDEFARGQRLVDAVES